MTPADIALIESALDLVLPRHYSEFVLDYPAALREARLDLGHRTESPEDSFLFDDAASVIELNRGVREPGLLIANAETEPWPDKYLIIGKDSGGNYWCVTRGNRSRSVWFFDHEEGYFFKQSKSLQEYAEFTLKFIDEFNTPDDEEDDD